MTMQKISLRLDNVHADDRPLVDGGSFRVLRVPELLLPHVPLEDWIDFCDKLSANQKWNSSSKSGFKLCCIFSILPWIFGYSIIVWILVSYVNLTGSLVPGIIAFFVINVLICCTHCYGSTRFEIIADNACRALSTNPNVKNVRFCYRIYHWIQGRMNHEGTVATYHVLEAFIVIADHPEDADAPKNNDDNNDETSSGDDANHPKNSFGCFKEIRTRDKPHVPINVDCEVFRDIPE